MTTEALAILAVFGLSRLADTISTYYAMKRGGVEGNPIVKAQMDAFGPVGWIPVNLAISAGVGLAIILSPRWFAWADPIHGMTAVGCLTALSFFVAFRNTRQNQ